MKPKHIFTSQRVLLLPMAALLCVISVEVTRHPLTKYHIPLVGWIVSVSEYRQASNAYLQAIDRRLNPDERTLWEITGLNSHRMEKEGS
jgi:hypothetical protein